MEIFFFFFFVLYKRKFSSFSLFLSFVLLLWGCALVGNPQGKNVSVGNFLYDKTFPSTLSADYFMLPSNLVKYPSESRLLQMKNSFCLRSCLTWHRPKKLTKHKNPCKKCRNYCLTHNFCLSNYEPRDFESFGAKVERFSFKLYCWILTNFIWAQLKKQFPMQLVDGARTFHNTQFHL